MDGSYDRLGGWERRDRNGSGNRVNRKCRIGGREAGGKKSGSRFSEWRTNGIC